MKGTVNYELRGDIAVLEVDNPPVNPLSSCLKGLQVDLSLIHI